MRILRSRLLEIERERQEAELSSARRSQVKSGGRSDKIRTYNYKENRVTDHRIGLTLHSLDQVLAGQLDDLTDALAGRRAQPPARRSDRARLTDLGRPARARGDAAARDVRRRRARHRGPLDGRAGVGLRRRRAGDGRARSRRPRPPSRTSTTCSNAGPAASRCSTCSAGGTSSASTSSSTGACSCPARRPRWWRRPRSTRRCGSARGAGEHDRGAPVTTVVRGRRSRHRVRCDRAWSWRASSPDAEVWATDVSEDALAVARANLAGAGSSAAPRAARRRAPGSRRCPRELRGRLRVVVSNPPYVAEHEVADLPADVADWEPRRALVSGPSGLEAIEDDRRRRASTGSTRRAARRRGARAAPGGAAASELARAARLRRRRGASTTSPAATGCWSPGASARSALARYRRRHGRRARRRRDARAVPRPRRRGARPRRSPRSRARSASGSSSRRARLPWTSPSSATPPGSFADGVLTLRVDLRG